MTSENPISAGRIHRLSDSLVDQIAAGEVVERPASVVKELVENGLDAGATRIRVDVRDGGRALIAVTDDGCGMDPGEIHLALQRHATSKLQEFEDLERVASFGFRGEALPAIASVSRLRLFSRPRGAGEGHEVQLDGGEIVVDRAAGGPEGTRIEVIDLFGRIPARRKFLKTAGTEWGHIADWIGRLAVALPGVHFELRRDDKPPIVWPSCSDPLDRIASVLGEGEADALLAAEVEEAGGHLQAFVSAPDRSRTNANGIHLYVNGRPVRDKVMRHGLLQAYRDLLPRGRFPTAVLFLTLPAGHVDVNVHPAKWEVRFADPSTIHRLIRVCVRQAMGGRQWLGDTPASAPSATHTVAGSTAIPPASGPADRVAEVPLGDWILANDPGVPAAEATIDNAGSISLPGLGRADATGLTEPMRFADLRLVGQLLAAYLIIEAKDGLLLVDQHAAHERVLYERLRSEWLSRGVERQGMLLPLTVELDPLEVAALEDEADLVTRLGFEIENFGEGAVVLRTLPALLSGRDPAGLVRQLASELMASSAPDESRHGEETRLLAAADRVFATLACHSARRAGDHLGRPEQEQILRDLDTIPWAPTCPHGRPVATAYSTHEIERRFKRR